MFRTTNCWGQFEDIVTKSEEGDDQQADPQGRGCRLSEMAKIEQIAGKCLYVLTKKEGF